MNKYVERLYNGIWKENPIFVQMLGLCPTLAVTTSAINGVGMGLSTTAVLVAANILIAMLRKIIPDGVRLPAEIVVVASFVTIVDMLMEGFVPDLYASLGLYIPLIVVNCIILGRAEAYAMKNGPVLSAFDGIGMGLGFTVALALIGSFRELLGAGTIFGVQVMPAAFQPISIFILAPGAFFVRKKRHWIKTVSQEEKFEHYLSELSAAYGKQKNIEEAVAEVEESHTVTLPTEHSYVRIYGAMCAVIREDGDMLSDGYSVFQRNLQYLKEEIRENLLLCKSKMHGFTGLDVLSVLPVCFLPVVRLWAVRVSEGLSAYYSGSYGMLTTVLLFAATIGIYGLILWLFLPDEEQKDRYRLEKWLLQFPWMAYLLDVYVSRHYTKCLKKNEQIKQLQGFGNVRAFLMKKVCFFAAALLGSVLFLMVYQNAERSQILTQIKIPSYQLMMMPERAREQVKRQYQELAAQMATEGLKMDQEAFQEHLEQSAVWEELKQELSLTDNTQGTEEIAEALFLQVRAYYEIRIVWYHILFIAVVSILAFQIPEIFLVADQWKSREKRMSECLRLQTVVLLLIHYEKTTVEEILSQMENFAVLFQSQMAEAVDHFSYDRIRSLQKLKQEIPDEPVQRICDALEFCEELPVEEAFLNLEDEREYFLKKNMEERKNYQGECIALAKMAAYLPMFLLIILKLVVPFVAEGLSELHAYSQSMTGFF